MITLKERREIMEPFRVAVDNAWAALMSASEMHATIQQSWLKARSTQEVMQARLLYDVADTMYQDAQATYAQATRNYEQALRNLDTYYETGVAQ